MKNLLLICRCDLNELYMRRDFFLILCKHTHVEDGRSYSPYLGTVFLKWSTHHTWCGRTLKKEYDKGDQSKTTNLYIIRLKTHSSIENILNDTTTLLGTHYFSHVVGCRMPRRTRRAMSPHLKMVLHLYKQFFSNF